MLNENDTQQSPSYSIKINQHYIHAEAILKPPLFSYPEELNDAEIGLKVMKGNIILISETKLDDSFPSAQFMLKNYGISCRPDRNSNGGGLLLYVHEDIPSKFLEVKSNCNIESICVEVN